MRGRRPAKLRDACCYVERAGVAVRLDDEFGMLGLEGRRLAHHLARVGVVTAEQVVARPGTIPSQRLDTEGSPAHFWRGTRTSTYTHRSVGPPVRRSSLALFAKSLLRCCAGPVPIRIQHKGGPGRIDLLAENTRRPELRVPHGFLDIQ